MRLLLWLTLFTFSLNGRAQDFLGFLMPNTSPTQVEISGVVLPDSHANASSRTTSMHSGGISVNHKVYNKEKRMVTVGGKWHKLGLRPDDSYIKDYHNIQGTVGIRENLNNGNFHFLSIGYGSASDQPFKNGRDGTLNANYMRKFNQNWYGFINFSNNRSFLNNIPIPGFIYVHTLTQTNMLLYGFPFVFWMKPLSENFSFSFLTALPWTYNLKIRYTKWKWILPYFLFEQSPESYYRHDREERFDRFFWFERRIGVGAEAHLSRNVRVDMSGGYAFDREFSEARDFSVKNKFRSHVQNNFFISASLRMSL